MYRLFPNLEMPDRHWSFHLPKHTHLREMPVAFYEVRSASYKIGGSNWDPSADLGIFSDEIKIHPQPGLGICAKTGLCVAISLHGCMGYITSHLFSHRKLHRAITGEAGCCEARFSFIPFI